MFEALHSLGDHLLTKRPRQADHGSGQGQVVAIMQNIADKRLIDLDGLRVQALEVTEGRVTGTEIPQREPHPQRLAGLQASSDMLMLRSPWTRQSPGPADGAICSVVTTLLGIEFITIANYCFYYSCPMQYGFSLFRI